MDFVLYSKPTENVLAKVSDRFILEFKKKKKESFSCKVRETLCLESVEIGAKRLVSKRLSGPKIPAPIGIIFKRPFFSSSKQKPVKFLLALISAF